MGWEYEMMGSKWEDNGDMMGKNWIGMGNAQRITKSCLGLLLSRSGVKQGKLDRTRSAKKCRKKDLTLSVAVDNARSVFYF